jgi:ABC-2 type transport system permease protein
MKILPCFKKTFKENLRDWKILILALVFAPFFIYMMYFYLGNPGSASYKVAIIDQDNGDFSGELIKEWENLKSEDGGSVLKIQMVTDTLTAINLIRNKDADLFVIIPEDFTRSFNGYLNNESVAFPWIGNYGDQANARFMASASFIDYLTISYIGRKAGIELRSILNINCRPRKITE